jgi:transposase
MGEGIQGLLDAPRAGRSSILTDEFRKRLLEVVRRRPRSLELEFSMWTLQGLADCMAEDTGIRVSTETLRRGLMKEDIVFRRPQHTIASPDPDDQVNKRRLKKLGTN